VLILDETAAGRALAGEIAARGIHCVLVGASHGDAAGWIDPDGSLRASLGGARLVIVRPDRVVAAATRTLDPRLIEVYARERLGVAPEAL
jgi:hypothetical protein